MSFYVPVNTTQSLISFDPNLSYDIGFSFHSIIYLSFTLLYIFLGLAWFFHSKRHRSLQKGLPLFSALTLMLMTFFSEKLVTGISILVIELDGKIFCGSKSDFVF